jgi:adenylosuccinate synthase
MDLRNVVLFSGPLAVGKTAVRMDLVATHGFAYLRSSEYIRGIAKTKALSGRRLNLQNVGDDLDLATDYRWLIDDVARPAMVAQPNQQHWIVDAVRKLRQIEHFREAFGGAVRHVHFVADEGILRERYRARQIAQASDADLTSYEKAIDHDNERSARSLGQYADLVVDLGVLSSAKAAQAVMQGLEASKR